MTMPFYFLIAAEWVKVFCQRSSEVKDQFYSPAAFRDISTALTSAKHGLKCNLKLSKPCRLDCQTLALMQVLVSFVSCATVRSTVGSEVRKRGAVFST